MNLEAKPVMFEDIARQVLAHGFRKKPGAYINLISEYIFLKYSYLCIPHQLLKIKRLHDELWFFSIDKGKVTVEDVQRVARRILLSSPPAVAARGNIAKLPRYEDIQAGLLPQQRIPLFQ